MNLVSVFSGTAFPPFTRTEWVKDALAYLLLVPDRNNDEYEIDALLEINAPGLSDSPLTYPLEWGQMETSTLSFIPIPSLFAGLETRIVLILGGQSINCQVLGLLDTQIVPLHRKLEEISQKIDQVLVSRLASFQHLYP